MRMIKLLPSALSQQVIEQLAETLMLVSKAAYRSENQIVIADSARAPYIEVVLVCFRNCFPAAVGEGSNS